jgi:hypothetical protein
LPPPNYKKLARFGLALIFGFSMLISSCIPEPESPKIEVSENSQLMKVREWFEENKTKLRLPERGSNYRTDAQELILPFFEKEPDWDQFHHYYFPDGREVFEVSLENATKYFPKSMLDSFPNQNPADFVIQNIMFIKHETANRFDPLIARYYPDNQNNKIGFGEISYNTLPFDWSGLLDIWTYDENHFVGFKLVEGQIAETYRIKTSNTVESSSKKSQFDTKNFRDECITTRQVVDYTYKGTNIFGEGGCLCPVYADVTRCFPSSNEASGGGQPRDYTFDPTREPSSTSAGTSCSTCEYDPPNIPKPGIINNLKDQPCASNIFKDIKKTGVSGEVSKGTFNIVDEVMRIFNESTKYDYVIQNSDQSTNTTTFRDRNTGNGQWIVNLNNDYLSKASQLSIARTIIHESIHVYISYMLQTDFNYYNEFINKYEEFIKRRKPGNLNRSQHELMGEYVEMMAYSLKSWDAKFGNGKLGKPLLNDEYYRAMAFGGLFKDGTNIPTDSFKALVPSATDRSKIIKIIQNEQEGTNSQGTKCN